MDDNALTAADIGTWSPQEITAVREAFEYWEQTADLPTNLGDERPIIRLVKDERLSVEDKDNPGTWIPARNNARAQSTTKSGTSSRVHDRLVSGLTPARNANNLDASIVFQVGVDSNDVLNVINTDAMLQLAHGQNGGVQIQKQAIHEIGHLMGINSLDLTVVTDGGQRYLRGAEVQNLFGADGVLLDPDGTNHTMLDYHNLTRARPFFRRYRNIQAAAPAELAIIADLGYGISLDDHFNEAFYQDGVTQSINSAYSSSEDYAYGVFTHADNLTINQNANISLSGFAVTGVRITSPDYDSATEPPPQGNDLTIAPSANINVSGESAIGVLVSSGASHNIVHRGTINAALPGTGIQATGIYIGFGPSSLVSSHEVTSSNYGAPLVDTLDISGTISSTGDAIYVGESAEVNRINIMSGAAVNGGLDAIRVEGAVESIDITGSISTATNAISVGSTGSVNEINIMRGAAIDGVISVAANVSNTNNATITFGKLPDANGVATSTPDSTFTFNYGDIISNPSQTVLDLDFFDGQTTLGGLTFVEDVRVRDGQLTANGFFFARDLDIDGGTATFNNTTDLDDLSVGASGMFRSTNATLIDDVYLNGGEVEVAAGTTTVDEYRHNSGTTDVDGTLNASWFRMTTGQTDVSGTMTVTNQVQSQGGTFTVNGTVNSNTFIVENPATVQGAGDIQSDVTLHGTAAPGNSIGTLTVTGNFNSAPTAVFDLEADPGGANPVPGTHVDQIDVTGAGAVDGGTVEIDAAPGDYVIGSTYRFLTTGSGLTVTNAPAFNDNIDQRRVLPYFDANDMGFTILRDVPFANIGRTFNEIAFGVYFDQIKLTPNADLQEIRNQLDLLPEEADVRVGMNQLTGDIYGSMATIGIQNSNNVFRMLSLQFGGTGGDPCCDCGGCCDGNWDEQPSSGWITGYGLGALSSSDGNAAAPRYSVGGTHFGVTHKIRSDLQFGFFGSYGQTHTSVLSRLQTASVDSLMMGGFLRLRDDCNYLLVAGAGGYDQYESSRQIRFGNINRLAKGDANGGQAVVYLEGGRDIAHNGLLIRPLGSLQYTFVHRQEFVETGAGTANLAVSELDADSLRGGLGIQAAAEFTTRNSWVVSPYVRALWQHEFLESSALSTASFSGVAGPAFTVIGADLGRNWGVFDTGLGIAVRDNLSVHFGYHADMNLRHVAHTGSGGLVYLW